MTEISKEADVPYQTVSNCVAKWKTRGSIQDLKKVGRPSSVSSKEQKDIIEMQKEDRRRTAIVLRTEVLFIRKKPKPL